MSPRSERESAVSMSTVSGRSSASTSNSPGTDGGTVPESLQERGVAGNEAGVELGQELFVRQGLESLRSIHRSDDPVDMFVYERPPASGAAAVVVAHGREIGEAEAPTRVRGHAAWFDRYLDAALRECLADEGTQPGSLRLGQERELPVARQVRPITTLSAPKYPHQVPNRSKMRIIAATGPGAFFRCACPGRERGRRRLLDIPSWWPAPTPGARSPEAISGTDQIIRYSDQTDRDGTGRDTLSRSSGVVTNGGRASWQ